jgi:CO/xanthine dehydrogenase FAD-binding subunit
VPSEPGLSADPGERTQPTAFEYQRADSWEEAVELLRIWDGEAKIIAGGQSLVPMLNLRLTMPGALIDINEIGEQGGPRLEDGDHGPVVVIPALTTHATVRSSSVIAEHCPMLHHAVSLVGNVRVRNRGTFGGSIAHADPTSEIPCCVLAMGGSMSLIGPRGARIVPATEWFRTYLTTAAEPDELVTEVRIPSAAGAAWSFDEEVRRYSDFATVSVAVQTRPEGRPVIVLGGVADRPILLSEDIVDSIREPNIETFTRVAELAASSVNPEGDVHASGDHRRRLVRVLVRRALVQTLQPDASKGDHR